MNYVIQEGDTLSALARRFGTTVEALAQHNGIANPDLIRAGRTLDIPGAPMEPTTGAMPRARPPSVAARAESAPLPRVPPEEQPSAAAAMYDVGTTYNPRAPMNYGIPIGTAQPDRIAAPAPGTLTTGQMTPIAGSGALSPAQQAYLDQSRALETGLAQQQDDRRRAAAAGDGQRRATAAEATRAAADEEAANAAYGVQEGTPVAAAMTAAAPDMWQGRQGAAYRPFGPGDSRFLAGEQAQRGQRATRDEAERAARDETQANAAAGLRFDNASARDLAGTWRNPTPMTPAERTRWLARSEQLFQPAPTPVTGDLGEFENMTREQLLAIDPATLTREQWQRYDAALTRLLAMPGV